MTAELLQFGCQRRVRSTPARRKVEIHLIELLTRRSLCRNEPRQRLAFRPQVRRLGVGFPQVALELCAFVHRAAAFGVPQVVLGGREIFARACQFGLLLREIERHEDNARFHGAGLRQHPPSGQTQTPGRRS